MNSEYDISARPGRAGRRGHHRHQRDQQEEHDAKKRQVAHVHQRSLSEGCSDPSKIGPILPENEC